MKRRRVNKKKLITVSVVAVVAVIVGISACAPKANTTTVGNPTPNVQKADISPTPDQFGVVKADQWKDAYPYEYETYLENAVNTPPAADYLDPEFVHAEGGTKEDTTSALPEGFEGDALKQAVERPKVSMYVGEHVRCHSQLPSIDGASLCDTRRTCMCATG